MSEAIQEWLADRIPEEWGAEGLEVVVDQDEILVVVVLQPEAGDPAEAELAGKAERDGTGPQGLTGIRLFREVTRDERIGLARAAEQTFGRKVSWGARSGDVVVVFTSTSVPVMTRLRLPERRVLDTLIDAGVARSRSDALAWCVRLVGDNEKEWIAELRAAFAAVEVARAGGPRSRRSRAGGAQPG